MAEAKEKEQNPLHKSYGLLSNIRYIIKNMVEGDKHFLVLIPLGIVCAPFMQYLWTFISKFVIDAITLHEDWRKLLLIMGLCCAVQIVTTTLNTYYTNNTWWRYINIRFQMIQRKNSKVMCIDFEHLENPDVMDCYQKAECSTNADQDGIEGMMHSISDFLNNFSVVVVGLFILGTMNGFILLFILATSLLNFFYIDFIGRKSKRLVWDTLAPWWRKHDYMQETTTDFAAAKDIRLFGLADWLRGKYWDIMLERYEAQKRNEKLWLRVHVVSSAIWLISQAVIYVYLIYSVISGAVSLGNFTMYLASFTTFSSYVSSMLRNLSDLLARSREVDDFRSFLDFEGGDEEEGGISLPETEQYEFTFQNVSFRYPKMETYALKNLNLTLEAGERLAVVGLNGAGKSTFIKLLLRLYEPTEGRILLNGVDIREYNKHDYYRIFSPVFQSVELFAFPLAENVSMQAPEQTDTDKAEDCLRAAGLGKKLQELPQGVHTEILKVIYEDGVDLSGGEKQKLAFARALYKDAPVVILDEPTAALDALAESRLYENFDKLIGGKTAVYISHRLSSTQFCNHVAMFREGEMVEYGTHESLLERDGEYAKMFHIQAQYYKKGGEASDGE